MMHPDLVRRMQLALVTLVPHDQGFPILGTGIGSDVWMRTFVAQACEGRRMAALLVCRRWRQERCKMACSATARPTGCWRLRGGARLLTPTSSCCTMRRCTTSSFAVQARRASGRIRRRGPASLSKTGLEFGVTALVRDGPRAGAFTAHKERECHAMHDPSPVVPFVVTAAGQMGAEAIDFVREVHERSGGRIGGGVDPTWTQPGSERYWHRRVRVTVVVGFAAILRAILGSDGDWACAPELALDQPESFLVRETARLAALVTARAVECGLFGPEGTVIVDSDSDFDFEGEDDLEDHLEGESSDDWALQLDLARELEAVEGGA